MSTSLTDTTISGKRPVEDPCCSRKRSEDRLPRIDSKKRTEDRLQESDRGSTTEDRLQEYRGRIDYRKVPRKLEEEYRGSQLEVPRKSTRRVPRKSTRSTEEVNSKKSTEEVDYQSHRSRSRVPKLKTTRTQREDY